MVLPHQPERAFGGHSYPLPEAQASPDLAGPFADEGRSGRDLRVCEYSLEPMGRKLAGFLKSNPAGLVHPEELQDHHDDHDDADNIKDAVHTFSPAFDVSNLDFFFVLKYGCCLFEKLP
jgi:hypothetical protein